MVLVYVPLMRFGRVSEKNMIESTKNRYEKLKELCYINKKYFKNDSSKIGRRIYNLFSKLLNQISNVQDLVEEISKFSHKFDLNDSTKGNGYRSFIIITTSFVEYGIKLFENIKNKKIVFIMQKCWYERNLESYTDLVESLFNCLNYLILMKNACHKGELFSKKLDTVEKIFELGGPINQSPFYGKFVGFHYCSSMRNILWLISIFLAGFSEIFYAKYSSFFGKTNAWWKSCKYFFCPELRSYYLAKISKEVNIELCKSFWFLAEGKFMHTLPSIFGNSIEVNKVINIPPEVLELEDQSGNDFVRVPPPKSYLGLGSINVRLLSDFKRQGMIGNGRNIVKIRQKSKKLVIHCHGGGFIAQSSKSHELYLREWVVNLGMPILSIDYSLAPEAPFPRALEEVLYCYCWALKYSEYLGWTGESIILAGDSAGANLIAATVLKCIDLNIRKPNGLFLAYCPFNINYTPSPARMLCLMDPLLPLSFMACCLKSYQLKVDENSLVIEKSKEEFVYGLQTLKSLISKSESKQFVVSFLKKYVNNIRNKTYEKCNLSLDSTNANRKKIFMSEEKFTKKVTTSDEKREDIHLTKPTKYVSKENLTSYIKKKEKSHELHDHFNNCVRNPYMSPYFANEECLKQFPRTHLLTMEMDPFLDDSIMFAKKLQKLGIAVDLDILKGLPHGFLYFSKLSKEAHEGSKFCVESIKNLFK